MSGDGAIARNLVRVLALSSAAMAAIALLHHSAPAAGYAAAFTVLAWDLGRVDGGGA